MCADKLAVEQITKHDALMSKYKAVFADDHQTISQYFLPQDSVITQDKTEGVSGWTDKIFDTTAIQAAQVLANGQFNWWTPPNQPWAEYAAPQELKTKGAEQDGDEAKNWLAEGSDRAMREIGRSNFYSAKGMSDLGVSVFGTDLMLLDESESGNELFNFTHVRIGTYSIEEDYRGVVDTVRREMKMTYRQIQQVFGKPGDSIPEKMDGQAKGPNGQAKEFKILHCIFPREDSKRMPGRKDGANKPIASVYVSVDFKECMRVSGYEESPILCRRFARWGTGTVWGYGPAYLALPDARQVNYVQQYLDALAELHAYPRVLTPGNLDGDVDLRAGGNTVVNEDDLARGARPMEWATVGDYKLGLEMQEQRRKAIRDAFFNDAFKLLNSQPLLDKEMTAYEISQRQAEQLQGITPAFARSIPEFINPLMQRVFGIMFRRGKLGNPPQSMLQAIGPNKQALVAPEIVVTSRFNDALRALKNRGTEETMKFIMPQAEQKPEVLDIFDMDKVNTEYARNAGMPPDSFRKIKGQGSVQEIRQQRAKAMQEQRGAQMAEQLGKAGKSLGGAPQFMQDAAKQQMGG